jgi:hypothetical protein
VPVIAARDVPAARCGGDCLPAGAGLLTEWRRRAQRAPARQGAACRPAGVGAVPDLSVWLLAVILSRQLVLSLGAFALPRPNSA